MALLFSAVTLTDDDDQMELLVPGIPRESIDLRGWTAYESFIASIDHEQEIRVHVAACLYGEGQPFLASPEEIAYFTLRAKEDDSFLCDHCSHAGHSDFQFTWSPEMSYGKESHVMNEWERNRRMQISYRICNGIFNHTSLCQFYQGRLLLHVTIPFEEKPTSNLPGDNLRYYRQRNRHCEAQCRD